jgi:hypothetical protein
MKEKIYRVAFLIECIVLVIIMTNNLAYTQKLVTFKPGSEPDGFRDIK